MSLADIADDVLSAFDSWTSKYRKSYYQDTDKYERLNVWRSNNDYILKHNDDYSRGVFKFKVAQNKFADLLVNEFLSMLHGFNRQQHLQNAGLRSSIHSYTDTSNLPREFDWRQQGVINPVQYQGSCGSCYAFSALACIEAQYAKKVGRLIKLSEQNIVDCSHSYGNNGCGGGTMNNVFNYIKDNGVATEQSYPYEERVSSCRRGDLAPLKVTGYVDIPEGDENALAHAVATIGPVAVGIDASRRSFQLYESGIYNDPDCSEQNIDHAVVVVGYGSESGEDYWIVRNSWGEEWGEEGYVKMPRNQNNFAGIASMASYPLIEVGSGGGNREDAIGGGYYDDSRNNNNNDYRERNQRGNDYIYDYNYDNNYYENNNDCDEDDENEDDEDDEDDRRDRYRNDDY